MSQFESRWQALTSSADAAEEARRVREVADYARAHSVIYNISFFDSATGEPVAAAMLNKLQRAPEVRLTIESGAKRPTFSWKPSTVENIYPLMRE